uniref:Protein kinase domain-containing protein n=1 Tax=Calcidiscus leptoporus TaxID=127549 RepID=A0A7S0J4K8_9EUKA|mmetsp:Transcript_38621/g.90302  ORF Transcript_38621/g.90302 Transcript_38621/m.90302 type:complete len:609 (+) Transcript_38621:65-1891(+)
MAPPLPPVPPPPDEPPPPPPPEAEKKPKAGVGMGFKMKSMKGSKLGAKRPRVSGVFTQDGGDEEDEKPPDAPATALPRPGLSSLASHVASINADSLLVGPAAAAAAAAAAGIGFSAAAVAASAAAAAAAAVTASFAPPSASFVPTVASCFAGPSASTVGGWSTRVSSSSVAEGADADAATDSPSVIDYTRGNYTFCKRYNRGTYTRVPECTGLQSIDRYENLGIVGRGAFNKIYKAKNKETGEIVALKAMQLESLQQAGQLASGEGVPMEMMREMSILASIRHPNVVAVREVVLDSAQMFMVMELVDFDLGLLIEHMKQPFSEGQVKCLAMQLLSALAAVHECFTLHRDLKQTNLLLDKNGVLKLCDFGLSRRCSGFGKPCTPDVTSLWYRAPEILLGEKHYGTAVDMWSFGCIFAEWLQHGEPLFQGSGENEQLNVIFKMIGSPSEHSWPAFPSLPAVSSGLFQLQEHHTMSLGGNGELIKMPKNLLRKNFPAVGYTPSAAALAQYKSTALSELGFDLLNSLLTCNPENRISAAKGLYHGWFGEEPLPVPLSRSEIRSLRRNRDEAIKSGAHQQAIQQQKAQANARIATSTAAAIAASIKARMQGLV